MKPMRASKTFLSRVETGLLFHASVVGIWLVFAFIRLIDERFRRAIESFEATYQFRVGTSTRRLIVSDSRVRTRRGAVEAPEFEIVFLDLPGALRHMLKDANDMLTLMVENKIDQTGNNYYLFKFGYLCGLCERSLRELPSRILPSSRLARRENRT